MVVNRIIPEEVNDPYFGKWKDIQAEHLPTVRESFAPVPILTARLFDREMVGVENLLRAMGAEVYGDRDATERAAPRRPYPGAETWRVLRASLRLPFMDRPTSTCSARPMSSMSGSAPTSGT